jgi:hypothetical protein
MPYTTNADAEAWLAEALAKHEAASKANAEAAEANAAATKANAAVLYRLFDHIQTMNSSSTSMSSNSMVINGTANSNNSTTTTNTTTAATTTANTTGSSNTHHTKDGTPVVLNNDGDTTLSKKIDAKSKLAVTSVVSPAEDAAAKDATAENAAADAPPVASTDTTTLSSLYSGVPDGATMIYAIGDHGLYGGWRQTTADKLEPEYGPLCACKCIIITSM